MSSHSFPTRRSSDLAPEQRRLALLNAARRGPSSQRPFVVSALTGEGIEELLAGVEARLSAKHLAFDIDLPPQDGEGLSWLYAQARCLAESRA